MHKNISLHFVPSRHPAGEPLDSYLSNKMLEICLCQSIMKRYPVVKGLKAENNLSNGHSQQNYIIVDAGRNDLERKKAKIEKTMVSLLQEKKKVVKK